MAELHLARLTGAGGFAKLVAIKRMLPHLAHDRQLTDMFLTEARLAARLSHPNVCHVFELGEADGVPFLVMEYLDGVSWDVLARQDLRLTAGALAQAAEGLHHAHAAGIVHRDISPHNLFVTVDGVCKVLDFGVAKLVTELGKTNPGVLVGKLPYMAPEQLRGDPVDARTDVFSLGVCAWEALAGARLYDGPGELAIYEAITERDAPSLTTCPPAVAAVIARALERDPARRHPTAQAFADELRGHAGFAAPSELAAAVRTHGASRLAERARIVTAATMRDRPPPPAESVHLRETAVPVVRTRRRTGRMVALLAAGAAIAATVTVVLVIHRSQPDAVAPPPPPDAPPGFATGIQTLGKGLQHLRDTLAPLQQLRLGQLAVESPVTVTVYSDDRSLGQTPLTADLEIGHHTLRVVHADGREQTRDVIIYPQQLTTERFRW